MSIEHVRLSAKARDQLITLKRYTGVENWNVLCRWAFCASLAEPSPPPATKIPSDGNIEMTWRTFAGVHEQIYLALIRERCLLDGYDLEDAAVLTEQFRLHLHRGLGYLAGDRTLRNVADLVGLARTKDGAQRSDTPEARAATP